MDRRERFSDPEEAMRVALDAHSSGIWTCLPGIIQSFDAARKTATVQPAIRGRNTDSLGNVSFVDLPLLLDCPVQFPSGGGYTLTFPIAAGDECIIKIADRCIDAWWQSGGVQAPIDYRMHDLSDGFVIVGVSSLPNVQSGISTNSVQLRNNAGTTYIELKTGEVKVIAPVKVTVTSPGAEFSGNVTIHGILTVAGINMNTHHHGGISPGGSYTAGPS